MSTATIAKVQEVLAKFMELLSGMSGIGIWLFIVGFVLIIILVAALVLKAIVALVRIIPNLTVGQFVKLIIVLALVLMIAGLLIP